MTLLPILRRIQRPTTQGNSGHAKYENSRNKHESNVEQLLMKIMWLLS